MTQEQTTQDFSVPEPARIIVENIRGSVDIQSVDESNISVTAIKHLDTGDAERTEISIAQDTDETVTVKTRYLPKAWYLFPRRQPCKVDYIIRVPSACSLEVSGVSNSVTISGVDGNAAINTVSGPLDLGKLHGHLKITSVSGDIKGELLSGRLKLKTVSGDVELVESSFGEINGATVSGDLTIQTQLTGAYDFDSVSGDVCLIVAPDSNCSVKVSSVSGKFVTALPSSKTQHRRGERSYEIGTGTARLHFKSISGDLSITLADSAPAILPDEIESDAQEKRIKLLERIDKGELSVGEALQELGA
jgi:hypothetical protein